MRRPLRTVLSVLTATTSLLTPAAAAHDGLAVVWTPVGVAASATDSTQRPQSVSGFAEGPVFARLGSGDVVASFDYGETWTTRARGVPGPHFVMATPRVGYTAGVLARDWIYRTIDGGVSWTRMAPPRWPGRQAGSDRLGWDARFSSFSVRGTSPSPAGYLMHQTSEGEGPLGGCAWGPYWATVGVHGYDATSGEWRWARLRRRANVEDHGWVNERVGWALVQPHVPEAEGDDQCVFAGIVSEREIYLTTDGGRSYRPVFQGAVSEVHMPSPHVIIAGTFDGIVLRSEDGGKTFAGGQRLGLPAIYAGEIKLIEFAGTKVGYAAADSNALWRTDDGGKTWTPEVSWGPIAPTSLAVLDGERAIAVHPGASLRVRRTLP